MEIYVNMTRAERVFMARRLPRTYRAMQAASRERTAAGQEQHGPAERRRLRAATFDRRRHYAAKARRLSALPGRCRATPAAQGYFETRIRDIRTLVTALTGYSWAELASRRRDRHVVRVRQAAMYLLLTHSHLNLLQVGALFGGRDHTTVMHARDRVVASPAEFQDIIEAIEKKLGVH